MDLEPGWLSNGSTFKGSGPLLAQNLSIANNAEVKGMTPGPLRLP